MSEMPFIMIEMPDNLSNEVVVSMCELLYNFASAIENHYACQLKQHVEKLEMETVEKRLEIEVMQKMLEMKNIEKSRISSDEDSF
jgi:hypothetical protein